MSATRDDWVAKTRARRGPPGVPFATGLVPDDCADPERALQAAAVAALHAIAGRRISVGFEAGASYADLENDVANLAFEIAQCGDPRWLAERAIAIGVHEGAHLKLSRVRPSGEPPLFGWLHNLIEDERIECAIARYYPVFAFPLAQLRRDVLRVEPAPVGLVAVLFMLVRAPDRLVPRAWRRNEAFVRAVTEILEPFPRSPAAVTRATRRIFELLPEELRRAEPPSHLLGHGCTHEGGHPRDEWGGRRRRGGHGWSGDPGGVASDPPVRWSDAARDAAGYERIRREVMAEARWLADRLRALLPRRRDERARTGLLDRRRLYAYRHDERLFRVRGPRPHALSVAVIMDLSGSMRGACEALAQRVAITFAEAAALLPGVRLHAYGHSADLAGTPSTDVVRFPAAPNGRLEGLGALPIGRNNRDAHAITAIGRDLVERAGRRAGPRIAVLICDGLPDAKGFHGEAALRATRQSIARLEHDWGPTILLATKDVPTLDRLGRVAACHADPARPARALARHLGRMLRS